MAVPQLDALFASLDDDDSGELDLEELKARHAHLLSPRPASYSGPAPMSFECRQGVAAAPRRELGCCCVVMTVAARVTADSLDG